MDDADDGQSPSPYGREGMTTGELENVAKYLN